MKTSCPKTINTILNSFRKRQNTLTFRQKVIRSFQSYINLVCWALSTIKSAIQPRKLIVKRIYACFLLKSRKTKIKKKAIRFIGFKDRAFILLNNSAYKTINSSIRSSFNIQLTSRSSASKEIVGYPHTLHKHKLKMIYFYRIILDNRRKFERTSSNKSLKIFCR